MKFESVITQFRVEQEIRSYFNPVRNLTTHTLASALDQFAAGYLESAARIFADVAERDGFIQSVVSKRKDAVAALPWEIVIQGDDEAASEAQSKVLNDFFNSVEVSHAIKGDKRGSVSLLVKQMLNALECGDSGHEIIWRPTPEGYRAELRFVPLYFFERTTGKLRFLNNPMSQQGEELNEREWLICSADCALMKATTIMYLYKRMAMTDWLILSQRFGMPIPFGKTDAAFGSDDWNAAYRTMANIQNGNGLLLSTGSDFDLVQPNAQNAPMREIIEDSNRSISVIWRGSDLGTMSNQNGAGASLQGDETSIFADADARLVEETIEHGLTKHVIEYHFGKGTPLAAKFTLKRKKGNVKETLEIIKLAAELDCRISKSALYEMTELPTPGANDELVQILSLPGPVQSFANESGGIADLVALAKARGLDVQPLADELASIGAETDQQRYIDRLADLEKRLTEFFNGGKHEAAVWQKIFTREIKEIQE